MLRIAQLEELVQLQLELPALVDRYERRIPGAADDLAEWLHRTETALLRNRLVAAAEVAALRAGLIAARRGIYPNELTLTGRGTPRKFREAVLIQAVRHTREALGRLLDAPLARVDDAERAVRQILSVAGLKGLIPIADPAVSHTDRLIRLWDAMAHDKDLAAPCAQIAGLVATHDKLVLLDRALSH